MKSRMLVILAALLIGGIGAYAQSSNGATSPTISVQLIPTVRIPVAATAEYFGIGAQGLAAGEIAFGSGIRPFAGVSTGYAFDPFRADNTLSSILGMISVGAGFDLTPRLTLRASGSVGYGYMLINDPGAISVDGPTAGGGLVAGGGLGVAYMLSPALDLGLSAGVTYQGGYFGTVVSLSTAYYVAGAGTRLARLRAQQRESGVRTPDPGRGLELLDARVEPIFPVFYSYYDSHAVGSATLTNREPLEASDIELSVFIRQYMDAPKTCPAPQRLGPGESVQVDLYALLTEAILLVTEGTKVSMELTLRYEQDGLPYERVVTQSIDVQHRNAMTWDDDNRAAAFVTALDPAVAAFSRNITGMTRSRTPVGISIPLATALALHQALDLYGLGYVPDPTTPYVEYSQSSTRPDVLQFPAQTLEYKGGDCDDLSILYCALLEASGVESAFVTVPGHIYSAVNLGISPDEARASFSSTEHLIIADDEVWLPVEITERSRGFLEAWEEGASEWRGGQGALYPVRRAWETYRAVGLPGERPPVSIPSVSETLRSFEQELGRFVDREIAAQSVSIQARIDQTGGEPRYRNRLGVLYARYGRTGDAETIFRDILRQSNHIPARVNLGNLLYLKEDYYGALEQFEIAQAADPANAPLALAVAKSHYALRNFAMAERALEQVAALEPALAEEHAFLTGRDDDAQRASDVSLRSVTWDEE